MTAGICAICHKQAVEAYKPFCSKRCADIDLAHWLGGTYAIPAEPAPGEQILAASAGTDEGGGED